LSGKEVEVPRMKLPDSPAPSGLIPMRNFGSTDAKVSALGLGGHHLGDAEDLKTAKQIVAEAIDGGITFFDNCWEYHRGKCEDWMGQALKGKRDKVFLMTKVCTHGRDASVAMEMLNESLVRLQTDHLDLWQVHGMTFDNDPVLFIRPGVLATGFHFDSVQMPLNAFDSNLHSFETLVLPELRKRGIAALGMKPFQGTGMAIKQGVLTPEETLRYAMSLPGVTTTITGMEKIEVLRQNLKVAQRFEPLMPAEMDALRSRCREYAADGHFELYKVSLKFDNPEARLTHGFPLDMQQKEVKEMMVETENTGHPYPDIH
jgi:predicted aldo/keto reductase-like oxidoreductase